MRGRGNRSGGGFGRGGPGGQRRMRNGSCRNGSQGNSGRVMGQTPVGEILLALAVPVVRYAGRLLGERIQRLLMPSSARTEPLQSLGGVRKVEVIASEPIVALSGEDERSDGNQTFQVIEGTCETEDSDQKQEDAK